MNVVRTKLAAGPRGFREVGSFGSAWDDLLAGKTEVVGSMWLSGFLVTDAKDSDLSCSHVAGRFGRVGSRGLHSA